MLVSSNVPVCEVALEEEDEEELLLPVVVVVDDDENLGTMRVAVDNGFEPTIAEPAPAPPGLRIAVPPLDDDAPLSVLAADDKLLADMSRPVEDIFTSCELRVF